jgi:hypothetical protein
MLEAAGTSAHDALLEPDSKAWLADLSSQRPLSNLTTAARFGRKQRRQLPQSRPSVAVYPTLDTPLPKTAEGATLLPPVGNARNVGNGTFSKNPRGGYRHHSYQASRTYLVPPRYARQRGRVAGGLRFGPALRPRRRCSDGVRRLEVSDGRTGAQPKAGRGDALRHSQSPPRISTCINRALSATSALRAACSTT